MLLRIFSLNMKKIENLGLRAWLGIYSVSITMPFAYIFLYKYKFFQEQQLWFELVLFVVAVYSLIVPFLAILKLFWTAISIRKLTTEKLLQLLLTYFYMLFAFAGIFLVMHFHSEIQFGQKAISGIEFQLVSRDMQVNWRQLPFVYLDMVYFSMATLTTLGFGDIVAKGSLVKIVVIIEALLGNLLLVLGVASIVPRQETKS